MNENLKEMESIFKCLRNFTKKSNVPKLINEYLVGTYIYKWNVFDIERWEIIEFNDELGYFVIENGAEPLSIYMESVLKNYKYNVYTTEETQTLEDFITKYVNSQLP